MKVSRPTYTAGVARPPVDVVAGAEHVTSDPSWRRAAVATLAPGVGPHLHVHLHQVAGLGAALAQCAPPGHGDLPVHVAVAAPGQADGLDVVVELDVVLHSEDGHIIPLQTVLSTLSTHSAVTHQSAGGESLVSDDSLDSLLHSGPVLDSILDVVVPQTDPQVLNVVFAHTRIGRDDFWRAETRLTVPRSELQ